MLTSNKRENAHAPSNGISKVRNTDYHGATPRWQLYEQPKLASALGEALRNLSVSGIPMPRAIGAWPWATS